MKLQAAAWKHSIALLAMVCAASLAPALAQVRQQAYVKASNTGPADMFGYSVAISGDTMVVGAIFEQSSSRGINGDGTNDNSIWSGAAYVYVRSGTNWVQQAYLKASNADPGDFFGVSVAISGDTVVVGALAENSFATGVNGDQGNSGNLGRIGAAYVFVREGTNWTQQAYLKPSHIDPSYDMSFGHSVAISSNTVVVGAHQEGYYSGAAYVFVRDGTNWTQQAYLKGSNTDRNDYFGWSVAISGDTIVIGAYREGSSATGINGNQTQDPDVWWKGAAYIFVRMGTNWSQQAYLKPSPESVNYFGNSVAISGDTVAVWSPAENLYQGAAYIFVRHGTNWMQQARIVPAVSRYGYRDPYLGQVALSGNTLVVGKLTENSNAVGINGDENDLNSYLSGAAWVYVRRGTNWTRKAYLKSSNSNPEDWFGFAVAVSGDTVAVTAGYEDSAATGINGDQNDNTASDAGAAYVFTGFNHGPELTMTPDGAGGFFIRCTAIQNLWYRVERAPSLSGPWTTNATFTSLVTGPFEFHDTNAPAGQAFYRVAQQ